MPVDGLSSAPEPGQSMSTDNERLKARVKKATDVVKGVAVAYVGLQLGIAALKFIGRRLRGTKGPNARRDKPQRQRSTSHAPPAAQQASAATATGEDSWTAVDVPPPPIPEGYKPIVTASLSCSPHELYGILFSSAGAELYMKQHRELGHQWDLVMTPWRRAPAAGRPDGGGGGGGAPAVGAADAAGTPGASASDGSLLGSQSVFEYVLGQPGSGGFTRLFTFWNPKKPPSSNDTRCVQRQQFCVYSGGVLVFATAMNMLDIPFKECFTVNSLWRVEPGPQPGTSALTIHLRVNFIKRAMGVGGIISATTFRDSTSFYTAFAANIESTIAELRQRAGTPLPAPLPLPPAGTSGGRLARSASRAASRAPLVSPFAVAAGAVPPPQAGGAASRSASAAHATASHTLPAWKQLRALLVFAVLAFTLLHQLQLGRELAELRGGHGGELPADGGAATARAAGAGPPGGLMEGLTASALGPLMTAAGGAHWLLRAVGERLAAVKGMVAP